MGTHHSGTGQDPTPSSAPGPRQAAARHRKKRALYLASAAGAALLVATATAAVITTGAQPEQATQAATIPEASTDPLQTGPDHNSGQADRADERTTHEPATTTAQGPAVTEEPEQDTTEPSGDSGGSEGSGESGGQPTGQGGTCEASFYGDGFDGSTTANGETFDTYAMTAAHKTLPFDTKVEVTNPSNGQSATVRINDRGPYIDGRCLDLSTAAFDQVIGTGSGVGTVDWQVIE